MSAFMVSKATIDYLVAAAIKYGPVKFPANSGDVVVSCRNADTIGKILWLENALSFTYRYEGRYPEEMAEARGVYLFDVPAKVYAIVALKQLDCYEYQSCEHDEWTTSDAKKFCDYLRDALRRNGLGYADEQASRNSPHYNEAPWGIDTVEYAR